MNYFKRKNKCCPSNNKFKFTEILGLMIAVIGAIIVVQILPVKIWLFILGMLLIILGSTLFKLLWFNVIFYCAKNKNNGVSHYLLLPYIARCTFPDLMHLVQTNFLEETPFSTTLILLTFGFHVLLIFLSECVILFPDIDPFPHTSQNLAMLYTSHLSKHLLSIYLLKQNLFNNFNFIILPLKYKYCNIKFKLV